MHYEQYFDDHTEPHHTEPQEHDRNVHTNDPEVHEVRGVYFHVIPLMVSLIQAAEKSLSLMRSSPEQVTANLASGMFPSFVIIQSVHLRKTACVCFAS